MNIQEKALTGYPSIDKPWLKYYSEEAINAKVPECTIYEYLWEKNKDYPDDIALVYMGKKITYRKLFEKIDKAAIAFHLLGIRKGDIVVIIAPSIPEILYSFYALNKIGAVSNFLDPRKSVEEIDEILKNMKTKACIIFDDMWDKFYEMMKKHTSLMLSVSLVDSLPLHLKILMKMKNNRMKKDDIISWGKLMKNYDNQEIEVKEPYEPNQLALLEHTGGTTGISKGVMLSNENVNSVIEQTKYSGIPLKRGESWLSVAFPFTAYSLICSQHLPLSMGVISYLCFGLDIVKVERQLTKYRCNHMANTPMMWEQLTKSKRVSKMDLSYIIAPTVGADSLDIQKETEINGFLERHNCKYKLAKGYGMTEVSSGICITPTNEINKLGSVGIPFSLTNVGIFDVDTGKELSYGKQGEICVQGPSVMLGYYKNEEANNAILRKHSDGQLWLHSGDLGYIDEDGFLFIEGRIKRMIIDYTGFKIFAPIVENVILQNSDVEKCCVVGIKDREHNVGQIAVAFVIPKSYANKEQINNTIMELCEQELPTYSYPKKIVYVESFPYTSASKVDYRALERMAELE